MRNLLFICALFTCLTMLTSCEKEDAYGINCFGDNCRPNAFYPVCQDDETLIISEDGATVTCPGGCVIDHCMKACTNGMRQCLNDQSLQICMDDNWITIACEYQCADSECIGQPILCNEGELRCSDLNIEACLGGQWTITSTCPYKCRDGKCESCYEGELRCSDLNIEACIDGQWTITSTCPYQCRDGKCDSCKEGELRCSDLNIETCISGQWTITSTCPYQCNQGKCVQDCSGPNSCLDSTTLQRCIDNEWQTTVCQNGCENGKCRPDEQRSTDPRLTHRVCTKDDFNDDDYMYPSIHDFGLACHGNMENFLGSVCIANWIEGLFCLDRCDPDNPSNYYCYSTNNTVYAYTADCVQISDGSYALINTGAHACESSCSPQTGCDSIVQSYGPYGGLSCNPKSYYCDGSVTHTCEGTIDCSNYGNKVCVQFGLPTYCATPCERTGDIISECVYNMSNTATCMRDDHGTLTWQYTPPFECENGCNQLTGLCN